MFIKGLLTKSHIQNLLKLSFTDEEKSIATMLGVNSNKSSLYLFYYFFTTMLNTLVLYLVFTYIDIIISFPKNQLLIVFGVVLFLGIANLYIGVFKAGYFVNMYKRLVGALLDNLIFFIQDDFRISLASTSTSFPNSKEIGKSLEEGALSAMNFYSSLGSLVGLILGIIANLLIFFITQNPINAAYMIVTIIILVLFGVFLSFGYKFSPREKLFFDTSDKFDLEFKDSRALLLRTGINLFPNSFEKKLIDVVNLTTAINFFSKSATLIIPPLLLFFPLLIGTSSNSLGFLLLGLYVLSVTFSQSLIVSNYHKLQLSQSRLDVLTEIFDTVFSIGAELTPDLYQEIKKQYIEKNKTVRMIDDLKFGPVVIKDLKYISGRDSNKTVIHVPDLHLENGKVHFLFGKSGIGKSVFGRLLTLGYSEFEAGFIGIKGQDFRTFKDLDHGLMHLHFSGLRNIETSYRFAFSTYLKPNVSQVPTLKHLTIDILKIDKVLKHFETNSYYYKDYQKILITIADVQVNPQNYKDSLKELNITELTKVRECYRSGLSLEIENELFALVILLEYFTYAHMKMFIPEASMYFMDAVLSEPPISQGQRRRVLFSLDILITGNVFVVDEPFSNLDIETSKNILINLQSYAKNNNAVVLVLDQNIKKEILENNAYIGKLLNFEVQNGELYLNDINPVST